MSAVPGRGRSRAGATPRGHPAHGGQLQGALTDSDIEIALDRNLTVIEAAQRLGRTHSAVRALRYKYRDS